MTIPTEFTAAHIQANADASEYLFREFLRSGEPFKSMLVNNPWIEPPDLKRPLQWGPGRYWDTTVARKHSYWKDVALPQTNQEHCPIARRFPAVGVLLNRGCPLH